MLRLSLLKRLAIPNSAANRAFAKKAVDKESFDGKKAETEALARFLELARKSEGLKLKFSDEEQAENNRIGKEFQRQSTIRHNHYEREMTNKIWLQQEAVRALPDRLREAAIIVDDTPPPKHRPFPIWATPPIKDFDLDLYAPRGAGGDEIVVESSDRDRE